MKLRNIAIIAHVDHGKTTLVDALLKQSENFKIKSDAINELIMDSNELERERGITIFSKNAAIQYKDHKINIVDTPGHADFGGEVERIMSMVDGVLLLVDAKEGPMPQTRFVLKKAIEAGHKVILVINKIDKPHARPEVVLNLTFDLFIELGASDEQANFPVIYAAGLQGKAGPVPDLNTMKNIEPVFEKIVEVIPEFSVDPAKPLQMLTINLAYDNYKGKIAIGRIYSGSLRKGMQVAHINRAGQIKREQLTSVMLFSGLAKVEAEVAEAGDIVAIAGIPDISIGETLADINNPIPLPTIKIDEPTVKMSFGVNTSPFFGKEGQYTTSRALRERLTKELETDVALQMTDTGEPDRWIVSGRGELHLSILIEKMRREGYEVEVSKPQVIFKEIDGKRAEPIEQVFIEVPEQFTGTVIEMIGQRLGQMKDMRVDRGIAYLDFIIPTRGLIGIRNRFLTETKGFGIMNAIFMGYEPYKGEIVTNPHGSLIASEGGETNFYGLIGAQSRGHLFITAGIPVYEGMVVGQHSKDEDLSVNVCKAKQMTNFRSSQSKTAEQMSVPRQMSLEESIDYIGEDELVEITPKTIRIRKAILGANERTRVRRQS
jgi:GTP-binding protein